MGPTHMKWCLLVDAFFALCFTVGSVQEMKAQNPNNRRKRYRLREGEENAYGQNKQDSLDRMKLTAGEMKKWAFLSWRRRIMVKKFAQNVKKKKKKKRCWGLPVGPIYS